jgi:hypothetical protein
MEVSKIKETDNAAWSFYSQEQDILGQLNQSVKDSGNPDFDPNDSSSQSS